ncbi:hypothetical protein [Luteolibacter marinus]|uniref:hypothetical protein n=1 Tax=Luteolibacter marinus TaxID=2776705 RepID=UPI001865D0D4|nr:hypothetical protein [Luteolibacter marinus]
MKRSVVAAAAVSSLTIFSGLVNASSGGKYKVPVLTKTCSVSECYTVNVDGLVWIECAVECYIKDDSGNVVDNLNGSLECDVYGNIIDDVPPKFSPCDNASGNNI